MSQVDQELALLTLIFPDSTSDGASVPIPQAQSIRKFDNATINLWPSSKNLLSPISQETTLALSIPFGQGPEFTTSIRELAVDRKNEKRRSNDNDEFTPHEEKRWIMGAAKGDVNGNQRTFKRRAVDAWTAFVDLLKVSRTKRGRFTQILILE